MLVWGKWSQTLVVFQNNNVGHDFYIFIRAVTWFIDVHFGRIIHFLEVYEKKNVYVFLNSVYLDLKLEFEDCYQIFLGLFLNF